MRAGISSASPPIFLDLMMPAQTGWSPSAAGRCRHHTHHKKAAPSVVDDEFIQVAPSGGQQRGVIERTIATRRRAGCLLNDRHIFQGHAIEFAHYR